ncbi:energy transducer TonB [Pseudomonas peli]|uniref:energy transducer TonB n=1 Tax=Pseudomonas peli TaxID=592361 RepID=UPI003D3144B7
MDRPASITWPRLPIARLRNAQAALLTLALHALVLALLLANWPVEKPPAPSINTISMQLLSLPPPAPVVEAAPPVPVEAPPPQVRAPVEPQVDPRIAQQKLEQAALAHKRVEQKRLEQERQHKLQEQARLEQQQREQAQQRQAAEQLAAQQLQQAADAAAEQARQAEAAAAASRQYLPIAKQAPAYPQRALDKGIEGECTVSYTVNAQGRVEQPEVIGACHPMFIRPSLAAAQSFRYQPRVIDGRAVAVPNVKNTFTYRIE